MISRRTRTLTLLDLIRIVSLYSRNDHEMSLAVADLINRGQIRLGGRFRNRRIVVS